MSGAAASAARAAIPKKVSKAQTSALAIWDTLDTWTMRMDSIDSGGKRRDEAGAASTWLLVTTAAFPREGCPRCPISKDEIACFGHPPRIRGTSRVCNAPRHGGRKIW